MDKLIILIHLGIREDINFIERIKSIFHQIKCARLMYFLWSLLIIKVLRCSPVITQLV